MYKVTIEREDCEPVRIESEAIIVIGAKVIDNEKYKCQMFNGVSNILEYIDIISFGAAIYIKDVAEKIPYIQMIPRLQKKFGKSVTHDIASQIKDCLLALNKLTPNG